MITGGDLVPARWHIASLSVAQEPHSSEVAKVTQGQPGHPLVTRAEVLCVRHNTAVCAPAAPAVPTTITREVGRRDKPERRVWVTPLWPGPVIDFDVTQSTR